MKDQHVLILGLGASGLAMARWCSRQGAQVTVADTRENPPQLDALRAECPAAHFVAGAFDEALLARAPWQLIARSPGLAPASLQTVFDWAQANTVPIVGELGLFAQALHALAERDPWPYRPQVLAVTGTNGKTTVTALTGLLLQRAGVRVAVAGNIGPTLLDVLSAALDHEALAQAQDAAHEAQAAAEAEQAALPVSVPDNAEGETTSDAEVSLALDDGADTAVVLDDEVLPATEDEDGPAMLVPPPPAPLPPPHLPRVWVLELSSFQLDGCAGGPWDALPTAATVLNLSEDHLDWHGSMAAYAQAKATVFGAQAQMVLNRDDAQVMAWQPGMVTVKIGKRNRQVPARAWVSFGLDLPRRAGDWGIETVNGISWLVRALALDETRVRGRDADEEETYLQRLMPVEALRIRGRHNAANALAALALATSTGAPMGPMLHGLREYRGERHRVEPVGIVEGVEYFDDSKGTNVGATLAAIKGLGAERRLVVILGGDGKGQDFTPLADALARFARAVLFIGRDGPRVRAAVNEALALAQVAMHDAASLEDAVRQAAGLAQPGDAVLMSPACASLDMFKNYEHRAQVFVEAVGQLALEHGSSLEGAL